MDSSRAHLYATLGRNRQPVDSTHGGHAAIHDGFMNLYLRCILAIGAHQCSVFGRAILDGHIDGRILLTWQRRRDLHIGDRKAGTAAGPPGESDEGQDQQEDTVRPLWRNHWAKVKRREPVDKRLSLFVLG